MHKREERGERRRTGPHSRAALKQKRKKSEGREARQPALASRATQITHAHTHPEREAKPTKRKGGQHKKAKRGREKGRRKRAKGGSQRVGGFGEWTMHTNTRRHARGGRKAGGGGAGSPQPNRKSNGRWRGDGPRDAQNDVVVNTESERETHTPGCTRNYAPISQ